MNNVTLTEQGHLVVGNVGIPAAVVPAIEAHYRAKFAAERMPEDVQKLVEDLKRKRDDLAYDHPHEEESETMALLREAAAALEAAYAQKGVVDDPR